MNKKIFSLLNKKEKLAIGLLSGTSVDGIDAVLLKIKDVGTSSMIKIINFKTYKFSPVIRDSILKNSNVKTARIDEICRLNVLIGKLFAEAAMKLCKKNHILPEKIDLIGSHGQTVHHLPDGKEFLGHRLKSTLQIGDPSVIANLTGITTVGDFRIADCAVGGGGAPLVPYLDYILFRSKTKNRALLNIGGIANITVIQKTCSKEDVAAFDTGPGNMLVDALMKKLFNKPFDKGGLIGLKGSIDLMLLEFLLKEPFYRTTPPKSTGREHYGDAFIDAVLKKAKGTNKKNIVATVSLFTPLSIYFNYEKFIKPKVKIDELLISGGGSRNKLFMDFLKIYITDAVVIKMNHHGITPDNKEAVLFAVLANECIEGNRANLMKVTGAKKPVVLGKICI